MTLDDRVTALVILVSVVGAMYSPSAWKWYRRHRFGQTLTNLDRLSQELEERRGPR